MEAIETTEIKRQVNSMLKRNQLSVTNSRLKILELFLANNGALAHADIERKTQEKFDRVTVYRTLQSFMDKGMIHSIPTADNSIRYALCKDDCSQGQHHDNHIHFVCNICANTICLDDVHIPAVTLPGGYKAEQIEMVVSGKCRDCNK